MSHRFVVFIAASLLSLLSPHFARAAAGAADHATHEAPLAPAKRYSGNTPIDMTHGGLGNNGTYGAVDANFEARAKAELTAAGLEASPYPYERKADFVKAMAERLRFFDEALVNLKDRSATTKPEAIQYSDQALQQLQNLLTQTRDAWNKAKSAGAADWSSAQDSARTAFVALYGTYRSLNTASPNSSK